MMRFLPIHIIDEPAFPYRGIMIDTARQFFSMTSLKKIIDSMALGKINVFHWHVVDDDSWPLEIKSYPDFTDYAAFSKREVYTHKDVHDLVEYAATRGVRVVPEIEGPAHLNSIGYKPGWEKLIGCFKGKTAGSGSGAPPYAPIDPTNELTYEILENVFKDIGENFKSHHWHLGGDEVNQGCWN